MMPTPSTNPAWVAILALTVILSGCAGPNSGPMDDSSEDADDGGVEPTAAYEVDQAPDRTIEIEGNLGGFDETELTVEAGTVVKVVYHNTGSQPHDWGVDVDGDGNTTDDARTELTDPGDNGTVTFRLPDTGEFAFFCDVPSHRNQGMEGTLSVE